MTQALAKMDLNTIGTVLARSGFFADSRDAAQAMVKVMAGEELGLPPVAAMTGIYIVKGRVTLSAQTMAGLLKRTGRYNYKVTKHDDAGCSIEFTENGQSIGVSTFTMHDAAKAGVTGNPTWKAYPRNMLWARAMSNGVRWFCPDVFGGPIYTPEETGVEVDGQGTPTVTTASTGDNDDLNAQLGVEQPKALPAPEPQKAVDPQAELDSAAQPIDSEPLPGAPKPSFNPSETEAARIKAIEFLAAGPRFYNLKKQQETLSRWAKKIGKSVDAFEASDYEAMIEAIKAKGAK